MRTCSYISAVALAAALIATPQLAQAQLLGVDVNVGGESGLDADVTVGGDSLLDADVNLGGDSDAGDSLVDVDVNAGGTSSATGPNGGTLIDLDLGRTDEAVLDADVDLGNTGTGSGGSSLLNGAVRIGSLDTNEDRTGALLGLIDNPGLADIDLDAAIDDTRVSIIAAADLLGTDELADIEAAIQLGGDGRTQLRDALSASVELGAILGNEGIDLDDVLAVQVAENGATEIIVLGGDVSVAALGDDGNLADLTADGLADLDIDLLSRDELAAVDLDLLPDDLRTTAQLRLLGVEGDAADTTPADLANVDLDLFSTEELAELDLDLLPDELAGAVNLRLLADDGNVADLSVGDLVAIDLTTGTAADSGSNSGAEDGTTETATDTGNTGSIGGDTGSSGNGSDSDTAGDDGTDTTDDATDVAAATDAEITTPAPVPAVRPVASGTAGATFGIAALDCDIGVLALANGVDATPQAIAGADSLELVRIDGCERSLVDANVDQLHTAIEANPAISGVLDDAAIPLDQVIGATVQADTLTLFVEPDIS